MRADQYMEKLKTIRQKYGCMQHNQSYQGKSIHKINPQLPTYDRKTFTDYDAPSYPEYQPKPSVLSSYRNEKEKEIQQLRQTYANSRKKLMNQYPSRQSIDKKSARESEIYRRNQENALIVSQQGSPIKRMKDFPSENNKLMKESMDLDKYWRQRQARLTQMTTNKLNEISSNQYSLEYEKNPTISGMYDRSYEHPKMESPMKKSYRRETENRRAAQYSVSNIDKIQQRIQSILGK